MINYGAQSNKKGLRAGFLKEKWRDVAKEVR